MTAAEAERVRAPVDAYVGGEPLVVSGTGEHERMARGVRLRAREARDLAQPQLPSSLTMM